MAYQMIIIPPSIVTIVVKLPGLTDNDLENLSTHVKQEQDRRLDAKSQPKSKKRKPTVNNSDVFYPGSPEPNSDTFFPYTRTIRILPPESEMGIMFKNGTIDLRTGEFTKCTNAHSAINYNYYSAKPTVINKFIADIMINDQDKIRALQSVLGRSLFISGVPDMIWYGSIGSGRHTLYNVFKKVLKDNGMLSRITMTIKAPENVPINTLVVHFPAFFIDKQYYNKDDSHHRIMDVKMAQKLDNNIEQFVTWLVEGAKMNYIPTYTNYELLKRHLCK